MTTSTSSEALKILRKCFTDVHLNKGLRKMHLPLNLTDKWTNICKYKVASLLKMIHSFITLLEIYEKNFCSLNTVLIDL